MKRYTYAILALVIVCVFGWFAYGKWGPAVSPAATSTPAAATSTDAAVPATAAQVKLYENTTYGYRLSYPASLSAKEYQPDDVVFGIVSGDAVNGIAEARAITLPGAAGTSGTSFTDAVAAQLSNLCDADGPTGSFSCTGIQSLDPFTAASGIAGYKLLLKGDLTSFPNKTHTAVPKGPYYFFVLRTDAAETTVLVVHAPLNQSAAEADTAVIETVAKSVVLAG